MMLPTGAMYSAKSNGPSTLPCGTPDVQSVDEDWWAPTDGDELLPVGYKGSQPAESGTTNAEVMMESVE